MDTIVSHIRYCTTPFFEFRARAERKLVNLNASFKNLTIKITFSGESSSMTFYELIIIFLYRQVLYSRYYHVQSTSLAICLSNWLSPIWLFLPFFFMTIYHYNLIMFKIYFVGMYHFTSLIFMIILFSFTY